MTEKNTIENIVPVIHNVLVIQPIIAPYRVNLFEKLSTFGDFQFTFAAGQPILGSALVDVECLNIVRVGLRNYDFGVSNHIAWQRGVRALIKSGLFDTIIAPFNPRYLSSVFALAQAKRRRIRFLWWGHGIRPKFRFFLIFASIDFLQKWQMD